MKNECYELFLAKYKTIDGCSVLVGGLCDKGGAEKCYKSYNVLNNLIFGVSGDGVVIDAQLARIIRKLAPTGLRIVASSIHIPKTTEICGSVIGDVFSEDISAGGDFFELTATMFGFALPGAAAFIMIGEKEGAINLCEEAKQCFAEIPVTKNRINEFIALVSDYSGQVIFVTDGSGGSVGCIYLQELKFSKMLWL